MLRLDIRWGMAMAVMVLGMGVAAFAQRLLETDGIELHGTAQLLVSGGGTCNVLETDTLYEERKANDGAPMDIWRLDFSVHNRSGKWLDHIIARYEIDSEWPQCTNWDKAGLREPLFVEWADVIGNIQKSGRNVVAPDEILTETRYIIVLRGDPPPRFVRWSVDFDFGATPAGSTGAAAASRAAPAAAQQAAAATPEQETVFWQSIMNSTNPSEFEAYLAQFPNGVFRALAEARLAALRAPGGGCARGGRAARRWSWGAGCRLPNCSRSGCATAGRGDEGVRRDGVREDTGGGVPDGFDEFGSA